MVDKFTTDGSEVSKRRPPGYENGRVRSEVGITKSVDAGSNPDSSIKTFTNNSLYSMENYCPEDSKKYKTISVGGLRAEQFAIKIDRFYREKQQIFEGGKIAT